ncbi:hypothetical protein CC78DRAFT_173800 [Lojkania enalia]|uniref:Myb-like DNA-binding domain-containing protein n=1 Tax=Lojkania enalia TaxID=147567 RepID=A0A9P4N180_9PLEO|nr:hypothetical protein CC78DRAFT_173800 [Didymosphaeria enalia]
MPSDEENVHYLYLILTSAGTPKIDWDKVSKNLNINKAAANKRWSRLKKAITDGKDAGPAAYQLLWLCVKHSNRDKAPDWTDIANKCGTTPGAASKRYSRMKIAFENAGVIPTVMHKKALSATDSPTKRKRIPAKTKAVNGDDSAGDETNGTVTESVEDDGSESEVETLKKARVVNKGGKKTAFSVDKGEQKEKPKKSARVPATGEDSKAKKGEPTGENEGDMIEVKRDINWEAQQEIGQEVNPEVDQGFKHEDNSNADHEDGDVFTDANETIEHDEMDG